MRIGRSTIGRRFKAVLDTKVFVSALMAPASPPARIVAAWLAGRFAAVTGGALLDELEDVAQRPETARFFRRSPE